MPIKGTSGPAPTVRRGPGESRRDRRSASRARPRRYSPIPGPSGRSGPCRSRYPCHSRSAAGRSARPVGSRGVAAGAVAGGEVGLRPDDRLVRLEVRGVAAGAVAGGEVGLRPDDRLVRLEVRGVAAGAVAGGEVGLRPDDRLVVDDARQVARPATSRAAPVALIGGSNCHSITRRYDSGLASPSVCRARRFERACCRAGCSKVYRGCSSRSCRRRPRGQPVGSSGSVVTGNPRTGRTQVIAAFPAGWPSSGEASVDVDATHLC